MPHMNDVENIFPCVHGWKSQNGRKVWMIITSWGIIWMINMLKCMDGIHSKVVMLDENHIYMDETYKNDEILKWMWNMNELLDDNWK